MTSKLKESNSMQLSTLITKVRRAKTAAEERSIVKQESAYLRTVLGRDFNKSTKRNLIKLMYIRMLGYPSEYGQVPCLALITKGDYSAKRVGYLALMLLLDESHETLMMVTNSMKNDLNHFSDHWIIVNALTALANIASAGMAMDLANDVCNLVDPRFLTSKGVPGAMASHIRKKALLAACRMVTRAPDLCETFRDLPVKALQDGNHAVVMAGVSLMLTIMKTAEAEDDMSAREYYATTTLQDVKHGNSYPSLLTAVLKKLHNARNAYEYNVHGICDPYLQVKVLKCLGVLGRGNMQATQEMTDILATVAAAHANVTLRTHTTSAAIGTEAASTIMTIEPVPMLRNYAVQIMANFLKLANNNMRYVALNTLLYTAKTDLSAVQRHRDKIVECVKDADATIRRRALDLVYALVSEHNVQALAVELLGYLVVTDEDFKPSLTENLCLLVQKYAPDTRWYVDTILEIMVSAGKYVKDNVSRGFIVRVTNANVQLQAYSARQCLRLLYQHLHTGADILLCTCIWVVGEFGDLLGPEYGLLEDEVGGDYPDGTSAAVAYCLHMVTEPGKSKESNAYAIMAAAKLLGRMSGPSEQLSDLIGVMSSALDVDVQQRSCEYSKILKMKGSLPSEFTERVPAVDESSYAGNMQEDVVTLLADNGAATGAGDLLGDLLGDVPSSTGDAPGAAAADAAPHSMLDDLDDLLGGAAAAAAPATPAPSAAMPPSALNMLGDLLDDASSSAQAPSTSAATPTYPPFQAWSNDEDGLVITFTCSAPEPEKVDVMASYVNVGSSNITGLQILAAVPKTMTVQMQPQEGGSELRAGRQNTLKQRMSCVNGSQGAKALAMRLKIMYTVNGAAREHLAVVSNFPAGL